MSNSVNNSVYVEGMGVGAETGEGLPSVIGMYAYGNIEILSWKVGYKVLPV